jgi:hypothetical protein
MYAKRASPVAASTRLTARQSEMSLHARRQCVTRETAVRWDAREVDNPVTPERGKQRLLRHTRPVDRVPERRGEHADLEQHLCARVSSRPCEDAQERTSMLHTAVRYGVVCMGRHIRTSGFHCTLSEPGQRDATFRTACQRTEDANDREDERSEDRAVAQAERAHEHEHGRLGARAHVSGARTHGRGGAHVRAYVPIARRRT